MSRLQAAYDILRSYGLSLPDAAEEMPWGHSALKVRGRSFVFLSLDDGALSMSVKLPASRDFALVFDFTEPTGYGLGRSGWVTSRFGQSHEIEIDLLKRWIAESYRALAPKKLAKLVPDEV